MKKAEPQSAHANWEGARSGQGRGAKMVSSGTKPPIVDHLEHLYERDRAPKRTCELEGRTVEPGKGGRENGTKR